MDPSKLSHEQLLDLVSQLLSQIKITLVAPGNPVPGVAIGLSRRGRRPTLPHHTRAADEPSVSSEPQATLRRPWTQMPAVLVGCQDAAGNTSSTTPQVKVPAEPKEKEEDNSPLAVAWRQLEINLVASTRLTKTAKKTEEAVMKEWSEFHDREGAALYSTTWTDRVRARREETADVDEFLRQRTERRAKEAAEELERARRLRQGKEEAARRIQAELERATAAEEAASLRKGAASAMVQPPPTNRPSCRPANSDQQRDRYQSRHRGDSGSQQRRAASHAQNQPNQRGDRCQSRQGGDSGRRRESPRREFRDEDYALEYRRPRQQESSEKNDVAQREASENRRPGEPRKVRLYFVCGHPNVRNPATCPNAGKEPHKGVVPYYYRNH